MLHLKFIIRQSQGSECRKHLVYWHRSLDSFWHCRGWCAPAVHQQTHLYCLAHGGASLPPALQGLFHQAAWFPVFELTCEQLFFHSIMSTIEALCVLKKRTTCQNCDVKVPYSVSHWDFGASHICVNIVTYNTINDSHIVAISQTVNPICFISSFLCSLTAADLRKHTNNLQDYNTLSSLLHISLLCSGIIISSSCLQPCFKAMRKGNLKNTKFNSRVNSTSHTIHLHWNFFGSTLSYFILPFNWATALMSPPRSFVIAPWPLGGGRVLSDQWRGK